jgi:methionine aminopeptidase
LHEEPQIANYGPAGTAAVVEGMVFAIEPMVTQANRRESAVGRLDGDAMASCRRTSTLGGGDARRVKS